MIIHDVVQGSDAWKALRLGIPTSSEFDKIITPAKGQMSSTARSYAYRLVAEALLNEQLDSLDHLEWVERGKLLEGQAAAQYQMIHDAEVKAVGFITTDDGRVGCSPDRLIQGANAGLEIKCPSPQIHIGYLIDGPGDKYRPQVQGQLLIAEFEWVDFFSYHPFMPPVCIRTHRDDAYIAKLWAALREFCDMKDFMLAKARASGFFAERAAMRTAYDEQEDEAVLAGIIDGSRPVSWGG